MAETILSVGIDVGTSTTEVVFSRLVIENLANAISVPRITIVDKEIIYRSPVFTTPLLSPDVINADELGKIVRGQYQAAGIQPNQVSTGAAIITGETARASNAATVLDSLSGMAGDFVVATAGPDLESVLAARGAGVDEYSKQRREMVANLDIGGGTTNIAVYRYGQLLGTTCLDIGGRLIRFAAGKINYIFPAIKKLASENGIQLELGMPADAKQIYRVCQLMARQLAMSIHLLSADLMHQQLYTNDGRRLKVELKPDIITFSGGVADLISKTQSHTDFEFNDIGVLLGKAIANDEVLANLPQRKGVETIGATVVGAGVHTTDISGSTIEYARGLLPLQNVPILRILPEHEHEPGKMAAAIREAIDLHHPDDPSKVVAIAFSGAAVQSFAEVQRVANEIIEGAREVLTGPNPLVIMMEHDRAKVLGQTLAVLRGRQDDVVCIDGVQTTSGDFIDIGMPVGDGRAVPVVLKTLIFNT